jgi:uncharacterized membrane protein
MNVGFYIFYLADVFIILIYNISPQSVRHRDLFQPHSDELFFSFLFVLFHDIFVVLLSICGWCVLVGSVLRPIMVNIVTSRRVISPIKMKPTAGRSPTDMRRLVYLGEVILSNASWTGMICGITFGGPCQDGTWDMADDDDTWYVKSSMHMEYEQQ